MEQNCFADQQQAVSCMRCFIQTDKMNFLLLLSFARSELPSSILANTGNLPVGVLKASPLENGLIMALCKVTVVVDHIS